MKLALAALLLAVSARALPSERSFPEFEAKGVHATHGLCGTRTYSTSVGVPADPLRDVPGVLDFQKKQIDAELADARARILQTRRLTNRIHLDADAIVRALNECPDELWKNLDALTAAAEGAAHDSGEALLSKWLPKDRPVPWTSASAPIKIPDAPAPSAGRYTGACRAPALDSVLFTPSGPGFPPATQAKLAVIATDADAVVAALRDQKAALDELTELADGHRCHETLKAFDDLVGRERSMFYDYREKAVAGAVWSGLTWKKATP